MATIILLILIGILLAIGIVSFRKRVAKGCCSTGDDEKLSERKIDANIKDYPYQAVLHIEGMHCGDCATRIRNAYAEKGCLAEVSLKKKTAVVYMKTRLPDEMLIAVPERIGYDTRIEK